VGLPAEPNPAAMQPPLALHNAHAPVQLIAQQKPPEHAPDWH
jgi:hypothetical protein